MKKTYVKPALAVESFVLSQSIALGCKIPGEGANMGKPGFGSWDNCGWDVGGASYWLETSSICQIPMKPGEDLDGICYHNPTGDFTVFAS